MQIYVNALLTGIALAHRINSILGKCLAGLSLARVDMLL